MDLTISSLNEFGWKLLLAEREENSEKNVLFSPFSITTVISMLLAGAKGNTEKQIEEILNLKNDASTHEKFRHLFKLLHSSVHEDFNISNLLAVDANYDILSDFSNYLKLNYSAEIKPFDFKSESEKARKEINQYIETFTKGKIKDILDENFVRPDTKFMLINAIYFKGNWRWPFDRSHTSKMPFYTINDEKIMVNMMFREYYYKYFYLENLNVSILEIPYIGYKFSMVIFLPKEKNALHSIEKRITIDDINRGIRNMREIKINLHLPKFRLEESFPLKDRLIQLGMIDAYDDNADLSGISRKRGLRVFDTIHKAFVEVNEEGTEAAAFSRQCGGGIPPPPVDFIVDHPFIFIIREMRSRLMLFTGSVYYL